MLTSEETISETLRFVDEGDTELEHGELDGELMRR